MARILIIDDEPDIVETLAMAMEMEGHTVVSAGDGAAGLDAARASKPDLIILDVTMPGLSGYKVARLLKFDAMFAAIPIIMLTGRATSDDRARGAQTGADEYLTKPFAMDALMAAVNNQLKRPEPDA
jgi:two-component system OmpR family response regulator